MEKLEISTDALNKISAYLAAKPYQEVFQLIEVLQNEVRNQPAPPPVPETTD